MAVPYAGTGIPLRSIKTCPAISLTTLGLGGAALGNLFRAVGEAEARATIQAALRYGIRYYDTAPYYGYGLSETRLGLALDVPDIALSTKVGRLIHPRLDTMPPPDEGFFETPDNIAVFDYSRDGVLRSVESSLGRLKRSHLDIVLIHDVGRTTHGEAHPQILRQVMDEALPALMQLRSEGVISAIGIGVNEYEVALEMMPHAALDCILLSGRYTLLEQGALEKFLPACERDNIGVIIGGPFNSGLLASAENPGATYEYGSVPGPVLERASTIYRICREHDVDVGAAALQFPLAHPAVVSVVPGCRSVREIDLNVQRLRERIPSALWDALKKAGVLRADAPCSRVQ